MDALARGLEQRRHRVLGEPIDLEAGVELPQLARDREIAPAMAGADRRRQVERALGGPANRRGRGGGVAETPLKPSMNSMIRRLTSGRDAPFGTMPRAGDLDEFAAAKVVPGIGYARSARSRPRSRGSAAPDRTVVDRPPRRHDHCRRHSPAPYRSGPRAWFRATRTRHPRSASVECGSLKQLRRNSSEKSR